MASPVTQVKELKSYLMISSRSLLNETAQRGCLQVAGTNDEKGEVCSAKKYGYAWPWLGFTTGSIMLVPLIWKTWLIVGPNAYAGTDGKSLQAQIMVFQKFAALFEINILTPIHGFVGFTTPVNVWANPVLWPFWSGDSLFATQASTLIAYFALASAVFALGRAFLLPVGANAGSVSAITVMPPFF